MYGTPKNDLYTAVHTLYSTPYPNLKKIMIVRIMNYKNRIYKMFNKCLLRVSSKLTLAYVKF